MSGLTRKKIKVRGKSGKTFQRSVMVRAEAIGKRTGGKKLNSLNPWEARHTEHVSGTSFVNGHTIYSDSVAKSRGSSGPGSDHSWFAHQVGATKQQKLAGLERSHTGGPSSSEHATIRSVAGYRAGLYPDSRPFGHDLARVGLEDTAARGRNLKAAFGSRNVFHIPQDPRKHVR